MTRDYTMTLHALHLNSKGLPLDQQLAWKTP
ncbi:MAG: hypothetical protein ACI9W6_000244 [Motiliproteus sp.]|jgi:hypothetical protein